MKRQILACFYVCVASALFARDAVIDKVEAFERGDKTSVVISYSGVEQLRFFALDATDGVFSLDLPGVYSRFDFNTLAFAQVSEVRQLPLDPDANSGISVRFFLNPEVTYKVFENGPGTLTVLFEGGSSLPIAQVEPAQEERQGLAGVAFHQVVAGQRGEHKLGEMTLDANAAAGKLALRVDQLDRFTHFFLENPKRFVLDMRGTIISLDQTDLPLDHPLVNQIRVRQFQTHPEAITRLVLDLTGDTQVRVDKTESGLEIAFADSTQSLAALIEHGFEQVAVRQPAIPEANDKVATQIVAEAAEATVDRVEVAEAEPVATDEVSSKQVPIAMVEEPQLTQTIDETAIASASQAPVTGQPVAIASDQPVAIASEERAVAQDEPIAEEAETEIAEAQSGEFTETAVEPALLPVPDPDAALVPGSEQRVESQDSTAVAEVVAATALEEAPATESALEEAPATESIASTNGAVVAESTQVEKPQPSVVETAAPEPVNAQPSAALPERLQAQASQEPEVLAPSKPIAKAAKHKSANPDEEMAAFLADEQAPAANPATKAPQMTQVVAEETRTQVAAKPDKAKPEPLTREEVAEEAVASVTHEEPVPVAEPVAVAKPTKPEFEMASDEDLEMDQIIDSHASSTTLYDQMKGVKSNVRKRMPVVVTNDRIATKKLVETSNMQDSGSGDFAELFKEEKGVVQTVGEEEPEYHGFEIMIDIRDQPVIDLLRFLADEVGFNLFVDSSVGNVRATYKFHNIPWDQALDIILTNADLDKEFRNGVLRVATTDKFQREESQRLRLRLQRELSVPTETVTVELNYARASDMRSIVDDYLSPRGSIIVDNRTNTMIIRDIPKYMVEIRTLINRLDRRIPQVSIEARIVETTTRFLRELGIQWGLTAQYSPENGTNTGLDFPHRVRVGGPRIGQARSVLNGPEGGYAVNLPVVASNAVGMGLTLGNFLDNFKLDISMQMLESEGQGQIISSPKVTTQNNKQAVITNGQRVPIQTIRRGIVTSTYEDAVLELQVRPQITADETVIMNLVIDKSELDFSLTVLGNPIINVRRAETQVLVKNGGTAVIGGIFTLNEQNLNDGLPVLRKMPVLRRLFGHDRKQFTNQELLIFVTPKIVKY